MDEDADDVVAFGGEQPMSGVRVLAPARDEMEPSAPGGVIVTGGVSLRSPFMLEIAPDEGQT